MNEQEAVDILDGAMLSDAGLLRPWVNAYLQMALSGKEHLDWLLSVRDAISALGVAVTHGYPKVRKRSYKGKDYDYCYLSTRVSPVLTRQYVRWYRDGSKQVPVDLTLTPLVLSNWFMGDGSSSFHAGGTVCVWLYTQGYNLRSIEALEGRLRDLRIATGRSFDKRTGNLDPGIVVTILQDSVNRFMNLVGPYVVPSYRYKVKYREVSSGNRR